MSDFEEPCVFMRGTEKLDTVEYKNNKSRQEQQCEVTPTRSEISIKLSPYQEILGQTLTKAAKLFQENEHLKDKLTSLTITEQKLKDTEDKLADTTERLTKLLEECEENRLTYIRQTNEVLLYQNSYSYLLGKYLISAFKHPGLNTLLLPYRLIKLAIAPIFQKFSKAKHV